MTPAQLDLRVKGAFVYERADGSTYVSTNYKLRDYGVKCVGCAPIEEFIEYAEWKDSTL